MLKGVSFLIYFISISFVFSQGSKLDVIPKPLMIKQGNQNIEIPSEVKIITDEKLLNEASYLKEFLDKKMATKIPIVFAKENVKPQGFEIKMFYSIQKSSVEEYNLSTSITSIDISSPSKIGAMHAIQTLKQLVALSSKNKLINKQINSSNLRIPKVSIEDYPVFSHRGLLLDCSRHFFSVKTIKKYIDLLSFYKMNVLHWHLTEDQGWRIQIDKYPELTKKGAWRKDPKGNIYGGFYSKKEIKDIVSYATQRHITIIPEIELPGHSQAAIASYPWLSCTGKKIEVANDWGVFKEIYCAGKDSVFLFLENVLSEVMELFPSKYIHIGGDEAPKVRWENCSKCQKRIKDNQLKDAHELQSYFIKRVEAFLNKNGRKLIGWDEILEGGLSENATVQSWRGMKGGVEAANQNHSVIMSPTSHAYFDYGLESIDLKKVYDFNPIPKEVSKEKQTFIVGAECNMWTEHVPNDSILDQKVFPRLLAMSEALWSSPQKKEYADFYSRIQKHYPLLDEKGVNYGAETVASRIQSSFYSGHLWANAQKGDTSLTLKYKWVYKDGSTSKEKKLKESIKVEKSGSFEVQAYKRNKLYGKVKKQEFVKHKGLQKKIEYLSAKPHKSYSSRGNSSLLDGRKGSLNFRDGNWQGFSKEDFSAIIDLGKKTSISKIEAAFYQYTNSWIFLPQKVRFLTSLDGEKFEELGENDTFKKLQKKRGKFIFNSSSIITSFEGYQARYIKIEAENIGVVPDWHEAAGSPAWMFIDEIIIK